MKTPEEWALIFAYSPSMNDRSLIEQVQKEAYNQAIDDAAEKAFIKKYKNYTARAEWAWEYEVNKESILKLKK